MKNERMLKIVFFGSSEFAVKCLQRLNQFHQIIFTVTKPDMPAGRGLKLHKTRVKEVSENFGIRVVQPIRLSDEDFIEKIKEENPDLFVVVDYGKFLPKKLIEIPGKGCIVIHPSLLPLYRGATPIESSIIAGDKLTGTSVIYISEEVDAGDIIEQRVIDIHTDDTGSILREKLSILSADALEKVIDDIVNENVRSVPQDHSKATMTQKICPETAKINWDSKCYQIRNLVRALNENPGAFTKINDKILKVFRVEIAQPQQIHPEEKTGTIVELRKNSGPVVKCSDGYLVLNDVQPQGKRIMSGSEYMRGYNIKPGGRFE